MRPNDRQAELEICRSGERQSQCTAVLFNIKEDSICEVLEVHHGRHILHPPHSEGCTPEL